MPNQPPMILLVDDDVDFVEITKTILQAAGYQVAACYDVPEAMRKLAEAPADLIITDLMMANLDSGFSFAAQVKQDPRLKAIPVIIATSVASQCGFDFHPHDPAELADMNVDAYFDKPVPAKELLAKIEQLLKR